MSYNKKLLKLAELTLEMTKKEYELTLVKAGLKEGDIEELQDDFNVSKYRGLRVASEIEGLGR